MKAAGVRMKMKSYPQAGQPMGPFALEHTRAVLIPSAGQDANYKFTEGQDGLILTWVSVMAARPLLQSQRHQVELFGCYKTWIGLGMEQLGLIQGTLVPGPLVHLACQIGAQLGVPMESCPRVTSSNHLRRN